MPDKKPRFRTNDPSRVRKAEHKGCRKIVLHGLEWWWRTSSSNLIIHKPTGQKLVVSLTRFHNMTWHALERARYKKNVRPITPGSICDFINRKILGYMDAVGFPDGVAFTPTGAPEGWSSVTLERGEWHWLHEEVTTVRIMSPEGVKTEHRIYDILGQVADEWINDRKALIGEKWETLNAEEKMDHLFTHNIEGEPGCTASSISDFIRSKIIRLSPTTLDDNDGSTVQHDFYDPLILGGTIDDGLKAAEAIKRAMKSTMVVI